MIIIYGTASSGKSNIAEDMAVDISKKRNFPLVYLATMEADTDAAKVRIKKHREQREGKGFYTIEEPYRLITHVLSVANKTVLLECVSNYCANVYFSQYKETVASDAAINEMADTIISQIIKLDDSAYELVVVTNDVFRDGILYDEWTESYMKLLARVNEGIARACNKFYEVVNGILYEIN